MPPKSKSAKSVKPVKSAKSVKPVKTTKSVKPVKVTNVDDSADDYATETFFNKDSYESFIKKNNIPYLGDGMFTYNDLHQVDIITPDEYRITSEIMTLAEYTRIISERAKQIENGSVRFIDIGDETDLIKIAKMEILQKQSPMQIKRYITKHIVEIWNINEMIIPFK